MTRRKESRFTRTCKLTAARLKSSNQWHFCCKARALTTLPTCGSYMCGHILSTEVDHTLPVWSCACLTQPLLAEQFHPATCNDRHKEGSFSYFLAQIIYLHTFLTCIFYYYVSILYCPSTLPPTTTIHPSIHPPTCFHIKLQRQVLRSASTL